MLCDYVHLHSDGDVIFEVIIEKILTFVIKFLLVKIFVLKCSLHSGVPITNPSFLHCILNPGSLHCFLQLVDVLA